MKIMLLMMIVILSAIYYCGDTRKHQKIVVIAPHPDDAEASCGGLIINAVNTGDSVIILTMTGGELGIWGKTQDETRTIRALEAQNAAAIMGAKVEFFGAVDASLAVDSASARKLKELLLRINPDVVTAPWPLDVHSDHQASGLLAWRVFLERCFTFDLYFYETSNSPHTKTFQFFPTDYIDITDVMPKKKEALYQQKSQGPADWWSMYEHMAIVNGYSADVTYAEAYIKARSFSGMGGRNGAAVKTFIRQK
ncbi:MAG: PIG-L family deacetylase [Ignavibacteriales bacterium]|nr:PIG-L family deacetylase [Ignavibacteriales bacterium]